MGWPTNYAGWITRIKEWLAVPDLDDDVFGYCIDSAHQRLNRDLNSQWMENSYEHTIADSDPIDLATEIPTFNRMRLVTPRGSLPLKAKALNEYKTFISENSSASTEPSVYCVNARKLNIWYPPAIGDIIDIDFYESIPNLSDSVATNIFSLHHPDALLYAALLEATPFIVEDERLETWSTFYNNIREAINVTADRANKGSTPLQREIKVM